MHYLQRAFDLAKERGYDRYPEVAAQHNQTPNWFRSLATDAGIANLEARRGFRVPAAMRELYRCPLLHCFLEATSFGELFLTDPRMIDRDLPPVVTWSGLPHLVFAFHGHNGMVMAAQLGLDDPPVSCGYEDRPSAEPERKRVAETFSAWVYDVVDGHESDLDDWQRLYEDCQVNPAEGRRLGGVEWIRSIPGMAKRLTPDRP